ncbi:MAG: DUF6438 domain-containing protein [Amphiplicatus sp.]
MRHRPGLIMRTPFRLLSIIAAIALFACEQKVVDLSTSSGGLETFFRIERTPCFGFCPAYKATVTDKDILLFEGEHYVAKSGTVNVKELPEGSFSKLIDIAKEQQFASFDSSYPNEAGDNCPQQATDLPGVIITVQSLDISHAVRFDLGCFGFDGRERLEKMISEIDAVMALDEWIGPREDFMGARE